MSEVQKLNLEHQARLEEVSMLCEEQMYSL